jgi:ribokinase
MILVCGALHLDLIVTAPHLPRLDETVTGHDLRQALGGKGGNQAIAAARMGARVAMAGRVGGDAFGDRLLSGLVEAGVDTGGVQRGSGASGMSVAIVDDAGGYGAVILSAANRGIDAAAIRIPAGTRILLLQNEVPEAVNLDLAARARALGARVILNAAPARPMAPDLMALVDLLVVNRVEAADLAGAGLDPAEAARQLAEQGPAAVVVTLGAEGVVLWDGTAWQQPGHPVEAVSTHGAGDAFVGALAADWDRGADLRAAIAFGQAAAALHVAAPVDARSAVRPEDARALARGRDPA